MAGPWGTGKGSLSRWQKCKLLLRFDLGNVSCRVRKSSPCRRLIHFLRQTGYGDAERVECSCGMSGDWGSSKLSSCGEGSLGWEQCGMDKGSVRKEQLYLVT